MRLSSWLAGDCSESDLPLKLVADKCQADVYVRFGLQITEINRAAREVWLGDGSRLPYHRLVLATGAEPLLPDLPGVDSERRANPA